MRERSGKKYGIKFDGEMLCIYLLRHRKVYKAWPKFQCLDMDNKNESWNLTSYGKVFLSSGLVGIFDQLEALLPGLAERPDILRMLSPIAISSKKVQNYYVCHQEDLLSLPSWYWKNKDNIKNACRGFINSIPSEVQREASAFTHGYIAGNQWFLIKQCQLYPPFLDLMRTNPALAYCFAHRKVLHLRTKRLGRKETEQLLAGKHRKIAAYLGLGDSNAVANILKKIPASACIRHRMQKFLGKLHRKELWKTLSHLETINEPVLELYGSLGNYPEYFIPNKTFVEDVACHFPMAGRAWADELWNDCLRPLFNTFYYLEDEKHDFRSLSELKNKYERVIEIINRQTLPARDHKYPKPPFPGSKIIEPVINRRELYEEGFDQKNCIYSYDQNIISGLKYVYRIMAPERATLCLRKERMMRGKHAWRIEEIKATANNQPLPETIEAVRNWFEEAKR